MVIIITHFDGDLEIFLVDSAAGVDVWNTPQKWRLIIISYNYISDEWCFDSYTIAGVRHKSWLIIDDDGQERFSLLIIVVFRRATRRTGEYWLRGQTFLYYFSRVWVLKCIPFFNIVNIFNHCIPVPKLRAIRADHYRPFPKN